jgi:hypothetical protein
MIKYTKKDPLMTEIGFELKPPLFTAISFI